MSERRYRLGDPVTAIRPLRRVYGPDDWRVRTWTPMPAPARDGIVIGYRTLWDGRVEGVDAILAFQPARHFRAVLVASDLHRRPTLHLPEDVAPAFVHSAATGLVSGEAAANLTEGEGATS